LTFSLTESDRDRALQIHDIVLIKTDYIKLNTIELRSTRTQSIIFESVEQGKKEQTDSKLMPLRFLAVQLFAAIRDRTCQRFASTWHAPRE
jgi:hypothetical protein